MSEEKKHILGCDEYHSHTAPKCCDSSCWCKGFPKVEWEGTVSIKYIIKAHFESEARHQLNEMIRRDIGRGFGITLRKIEE